MGKKNVMVTVRPKETIQNVCSFKARFLGIIDRDDRRAIVNTEKAADRIATSPSINPNRISSTDMMDKFLVFVTDEISENGNRTVFITPRVKYLRYQSRQRVLACADDRDYVVEEIF